MAVSGSGGQVFLFKHRLIYVACSLMLFQGEKKNPDFDLLPCNGLKHTQIFIFSRIKRSLC